MKARKEEKNSDIDDYEEEFEDYKLENPSSPEIQTRKPIPQKADPFTVKTNNIPDPHEKEKFVKPPSPPPKREMPKQETPKRLSPKREKTPSPVRKERTPSPIEQKPQSPFQEDSFRKNAVVPAKKKKQSAVRREPSMDEDEMGGLM